MINSLTGRIGLGGWRGGLLLLILFGAAYWLGTSVAGVSVHTGIASGAEGAISVEADGWTYNVPLEGVTWLDARGTFHDSGRPDCLPPGGAERPITFGAVNVTMDGSGWRAVVWVDCR